MKSHGQLSVFILAASILDAALTLWWISLGWATEGNPLLHDLAQRPTEFLIVKIGLTVVGVMVLWDNRHRTAAYVGLLLGSLAYAYVMALHTAGAILAVPYGL